MMIAVINGNNYLLNNYYTETSGRLHLFINCEEENYDMDMLETDVINNDGISIVNGEETIANLSGYTKIVHLEKKYDSGKQIYVMIDVSSVGEMVKNLQKDVDNFKVKMDVLEPQMVNFENKLTTAVSQVEAAEARVNAKLDETQNLTERVEFVEQDINMLKEQDWGGTALQLQSQIESIKKFINMPTEEETQVK